MIAAWTIGCMRQIRSGRPGIPVYRGSSVVFITDGIPNAGTVWLTARLSRKSVAPGRFSIPNVLQTEAPD